jgi:hypothetical protein
MQSDGPVALVGAHIVNVSPYGMLIQSPLPMEPGAIHRFRIVIDQDQEDVEARVAMCLVEGKRRYDVGLEFVGTSDELRHRLATVLGRMTSDS